jgi:hypothetical protein
MPFLFDFCQWLQETNISVYIRESSLLFPFIEGTHLLAIGVSAGTIAMSDLRLLGVLMKKEKASKVFDSLLPFTIAGFVVVLATGSLLFLAEPAKSYVNPWFWGKLSFMALAGINALVYHTTVHRRIAQWDTAVMTPTGARLAGVFSLVFWAMVIWLGRQFAYNH